MNWALVTWTAVGWVISGGLLYLTYKFGNDLGLQIGDVRGTWRVWKNGALVIGVLFAMVMFGTASGPDHTVPSDPEGSLTPEDWSRMLGILLAFACAYAVGFVDGRRTRKPR